MCNSNATNTDKSINEQIKEMFDEIFNDEFKKDNELEGQFIEYDGLVDEKEYQKQDLKVAFLLKDVNDEDSKGNCSLVKWLGSLKTKYKENSWENKKEEKSWQQTWLNVCYWCEILKNLNANFIRAYNKEITALLKNLDDIAIVNIKKTNGGSKSIYKELEGAVKLYGKSTIKEIEELIQPRLVICCGTFDLAQMLVQIKRNKDDYESVTVQTTTLPSGAKYFIEDGIYYLKFVHPAWYTVNKNILFAYAKVTFAKILSKIKNTSCIDK